MMSPSIPDTTLIAAFMADIPDHIYFKNRDSRFVWVNLALAQSLGRPIDEIIGKTDFDFFDDVKAKAFREAELEVMDTGVPLVDRIVEHIWTDGRTTWSLNVAVPLRDPSGVIIGIFGTNKDITASKLLEKDLARAQSDLRELSRRAGRAEVAADVVHEIGNVLNSANTSAEILAGEIDKLPLDPLAKLAALLRDPESGLPDLLRTHPQGSRLSHYIETFHVALSYDRRQVLEEIASLRQSIERIKDIVRAQETHLACGAEEYARQAARLPSNRRVT
jgi:PAS domain S-box-containing protein